MNSTSYHDLSKEKDYHNLMGGILVPLSIDYYIASNREVEHGRADHALLPKSNKENKTNNPALIIEYKFCKKEDELESAAEKNAVNMITQIGDSFVRLADFLKMYSVYCTNQKISMETIEKSMQKAAFKTFIEVKKKIF